MPPRRAECWVRIGGAWRRGLIAAWIETEAGAWECVITAEEPGGSPPWQGRYAYDRDVIRPRYGDGDPLGLVRGALVATVSASTSGR